jgi:hypothetical protein
MAWPFLVVLDLDELTVRCRACPWRSPKAATVQEAQQAYASHVSGGRPVRSPWLGWCAVCGRFRFGGLRPAGRQAPSVGQDVGVRRPPELQEAIGVLIWLLRRPGGAFLVVLLIAFALLASTTIEEPQPPKPYEPPPPCRLVPSPAGAWSDARCLHAPARHQAKGRDPADH